MKLLAEGGAAGHMFHPFDLSWVNNGTDLIDFFERSKQFVAKKVRLRSRSTVQMYLSKLLKLMGSINSLLIVDQHRRLTLVVLP